MILLPLAEQVLFSSRSTDEELQQLKQQKISDDEQRRREAADSEKALSELSSRADRLQSWHDDLLRKLGDFSGSEEERQAAALEALDGIRAEARAMARQRDTWQYIAWGSAGAAAGAVSTSAAGGSGLQALAGAGIGAGSGIAIRLLGKITGWW